MKRIFKEHIAEKGMKHLLSREGFMKLDVLDPLVQDSLGLPSFEELNLKYEGRLNLDTYMQNLCVLTAQVVYQKAGIYDFGQISAGGEVYNHYRRWMTEKQVFRVDETLYNEISDMPIGEIPTNIFDRLPYDFFFIEAPLPALWADGEDYSTIQVKPSVGCFVKKTNMVGIVDKDIKEYRAFSIIYLFEDMYMTPTGFSIEANTVEEIIAELRESQKRVIKMSKNSKSGFDENEAPPDCGLLAQNTAYQRIQKFMNVLLYLCSQNAEITERYVPDISLKHNPKKKRSEATISEVGYRIGATLRSSYASSMNFSSKETGRSVTPHLRRAHWHHYWTGALDGDRDLILKWIEPTFVGGANDPIPVVHKVKNEASQKEHGVGHLIKKGTVVR